MLTHKEVIPCARSGKAKTFITSTHQKLDTPVSDKMGASSSRSRFVIRSSTYRRLKQ